MAGEAFATITGMVLTPASLLLPEEGMVLKDLSSRPEDALPLLEADVVRGWWKENEGRFRPGQRYLQGELHSRARVLQQLRCGPMRRRHHLALELLLASRGRERVDTRAFSGKQLAQLHALAASGDIS